MKISDTFKDASGKMWLSLGTLSSGTKVLRTNIKLQNTGDLRSFAKIKVVPKGLLMKTNFSSIVMCKINGTDEFVIRI